VRVCKVLLLGLPHVAWCVSQGNHILQHVPMHVWEGEGGRDGAANKERELGLVSCRVGSGTLEIRVNYMR